MPGSLPDMLKGMTLNFRPLYINAKNIPLAQVNEVWLRGFLTILMRTYSLKGDEEKLRELVRELKEFLLAENPEQVYEMSVSYIIIAGGYESEALASIIKNEISEEAGAKTMRTFVDEILEAQERKAIEIAKKLSQSGMSLFEIKTMTGLSKAKLKKARIGGSQPKNATLAGTAGRR